MIPSRIFQNLSPTPVPPPKGALQVHFIAECGGAAEDNVEERENSEVTQFFGWAGDGDGRTDDDGRTTDGRTDRIFLANIILDVSHIANKDRFG